MTRTATPVEIAVLGAGLSGLTAANELQNRGYAVTVVDKARGAGGRMSTRRDGDRRFDHGAQYFTARDPRFVERVNEWQRNGFVDTWNARIGIVESGAVRPEVKTQRRYIGVPGMNSVCKALSATLDDCRFDWQVSEIRCEEQCTLRSTDGESIECDAVIVTAPPAQTLHLVEDEELMRQLQPVELLPCWTLMASFDTAPITRFDALFIDDGPLSWIAAQPSKPGRRDDQSWVLQASPHWSRQHIDDEPADVSKLLLEAMQKLPGARATFCQHAVAHRWRYAKASNPLDVMSLASSDGRLVVAGDWCAGSRVESAFLSGLDAARRFSR